MLAVFVLWGGALVALVALGAPSRPSELACAAGAGLMLVGVGTRMSRRRNLARETEGTTAAEPEQRRASV